MWHFRKHRTIGRESRLLIARKWGQKEWIYCRCLWMTEGVYIMMSVVITWLGTFILLKKDKFYSIWIIPHKTNFKIKRMSLFAIPKDTRDPGKGQWPLNWDKELVGTILGQVRLTTPELTDPSSMPWKVAVGRADHHFWDILVKRLNPDLIRSPVRTTGLQVIQRAEEHLNWHHRDKTTKIQYVGNSTGQTTQFL